MTDRETLLALAEREAELLETHIQRCRDAVANCRMWSHAQGEWSRARDALLNYRDELLALRAQAEQVIE